jgi:hypothetical protein
MNDESYTRKIAIVASPTQVFRALTEEVDKWWTTASDDASCVGTRATFRFGKTFNIMLVKELVPGSSGTSRCMGVALSKST